MNIKQLILWVIGIWFALEGVLGIGLFFVALFGYLTFSLLGAAWGTLLTASLVLPFVWSVSRWAVLPWFRRLTLEQKRI